MSTTQPTLEQTNSDNVLGAHLREVHILYLLRSGRVTCSACRSSGMSTTTGPFTPSTASLHADTIVSYTCKQEGQVSCLELSSEEPISQEEQQLGLLLQLVMRHHHVCAACAEASRQAPYNVKHACTDSGYSTGAVSAAQPSMPAWWSQNADSSISHQPPHLIAHL
jgi:hypothetical protein